MSEYLSKEEIKQWRSSLEKITLEEYAHRLGKVLREEKQTRDIVDLVLKNEQITPVVTKINSIESKKEKVVKIAKQAIEVQPKETVLKQDVEKLKSKLVYKKPLTQREETVLDAFLQRSGEVVYAKDLAKLLNLPNDYVYKYIKNLRTKLGSEILENATKGGYKIHIV
ncbi:MAG: helix-turn-helix domain-containing protein [Cyanobacteria bacterium SIG30]|nr:helix-turn-helix domain-containing protein [Cyanobacteria bacterium SIG30]